MLSLGGPRPHVLGVGAGDGAGHGEHKWEPRLWSLALLVQSQACSLPTVSLWTGYLNPLCLSSPSAKTKHRTSPFPGVNIRGVLGTGPSTRLTSKGK